MEDRMIWEMIPSESKANIFPEDLPNEDEERIQVVWQYYYEPLFNVEVERILSSLPSIDTKSFKLNVDDVFVFAGIPITELREEFGQDIACSYSQLFKVTNRFIYLTDYRHWDAIVERCDVPVHLLTKKNDIYILRATSDREKLENNLEEILPLDEIGWSEEVFFQRHILRSRGKVLYICDLPGMGKTRLLNNFWNLLMVRTSTKAFRFSCKTISEDILRIGTLPEKKVAWLCLLTAKSDCLKLIKSGCKIYIFIDDTHLVPSADINLVCDVFSYLLQEYTHLHIVITTRPDLRKQLEKVLGVRSYQILPLSQEEQVRIIAHHWKHIDEKSLYKHVIEMVRSVLVLSHDLFSSEKIKVFLKIPLNCCNLGESLGNHSRDFPKLLLDGSKSASSFLDIVKKHLSIFEETSSDLLHKDLLLCSEHPSNNQILKPEVGSLETDTGGYTTASLEQLQTIVDDVVLNILVNWNEDIVLTDFEIEICLLRVQKEFSNTLKEHDITILLEENENCVKRWIEGKKLLFIEKNKVVENQLLVKLEAALAQKIVKFVEDIAGIINTFSITDEEQFARVCQKEQQRYLAEYNVPDHHNLNSTICELLKDTFERMIARTTTALKKSFKASLSLKEHVSVEETLNCLSLNPLQFREACNEEFNLCFGDIDIREYVFPIIQRDILKILSDSTTNTKVILDLATIGVFDMTELDTPLHGTFQTEQNRILSLLRLIYTRNSEEIHQCFNKFCNLKDLPVKRKKFRQMFLNAFPNCFERCFSRSDRRHRAEWRPEILKEPETRNHTTSLSRTNAERERLFGLYSPFD